MKTKRLIMSFLILISLITLASCTGFFTEEVEAIQIASITNETLEDGNIKITITYTDSSKRPDEFIIPRGEDGQSGVGIKEVTTEESEDGKKTKLTITYTDETVEPTIVELADGTSVLGIETKYNEEENETYMVVKFSDGTEKELLIPKGEKGEEGNGIESWEKQVNDDKSVTITFKFTKSDEPFIITIPAPEKGNGIDSITSSEKDGKYVLTIKYSDPYQEDTILEFNKPKEPNAWISGTASPNQTTGSEGDYYMDTYHKKIYHKENNNWILVIDFGNSVETYIITFNLNDESDTTHPAKFPEDFYNNIPVRRNTYFTDNDYGAIPLPTREGYTFAGWYTVKNPTINNAAFTDLTPILSNLTLYAKWIKN